MSRADVVVVGAGHNGLTAAALLARRGRRVVVVERRDLIGGLAAGEEFHPGYRTAGLLHATDGVRPWVVDALELDRRHGLVREEAPVFVPEPGDRGRGLLLSSDVEATARELSAADADGYRGYRSFFARVGPFLRRLLDAPPPDLVGRRLADLLSLGGTALDLRRLGRSDMVELLRVTPMCLADWLGEWFESDRLKAALALPALEAAYAGPRSPGTTANLLLAEAARSAPVRGGPAALVASLERAARAAGVEIRTGARVEEVEIDAGRVRGVRLAGGERIETPTVAASCDPRHLFLDLVAPHHLSHRFEQNLLAYRCRGTTAKVHLALDGDPDFRCRSGLRAHYLRIAGGLDDTERAFDPVKYRQLPERPVLDLYVPTLASPELAPAGHQVLSALVHFVPYELDGGWHDGRREELGDTVVATLAEQAPGLESRVVGREVLSPVDLEERYGVTGGHLHHGEPALDQRIVRPTPECARYATPFEGLFLCGAGSHPGGGITCAPGALAARSIAAL